MACLKPLKILNPRYRGMDVVSRGDYSERVYGVRFPPNLFIEVPCGKCHFCQKQKFNGYRMRLLYELKQYPNSIFVTLTFDESNLSRFEDNPNKAIRLFLDRLRKYCGSQVRHWFVAEYGSLNGRIHYHGILFNCSLDSDSVSKLWKYGFVFVGYANEATAKYIVKYLTKDDTKNRPLPRIISSKSIGSSWLSSQECSYLKSKYLTSLVVDSFHFPLPRYYIQKMYDKRDLEIISYYRYMETPDVYYLCGKSYTDESLYRLDRRAAYHFYDNLGLNSHLSVDTKRLSSNLRYSIYLDCYFKKLYPYG